MADGMSTTENGQVLRISAFILSEMPANDDNCQSNLRSSYLKSLPFSVKGTVRD